MSLFDRCPMLVQPKTKTLCNNVAANLWTYKISASSCTSKHLNQLFYCLLIKKALAIDGACASETLSERNGCTPMLISNSLDFFSYLKSYYHCHPPLEINFLIFSVFRVQSKVSLIRWRIIRCLNPAMRDTWISASLWLPIPSFTSSTKPTITRLHFTCFTSDKN